MWANVEVCEMYCKCILCFLDEANHFKWRLNAQKKDAHNHQHIRNYKDILLNELRGLGPISNCSFHKNVHKNLIVFWENVQKDISFKTLISDFLQYIEVAYKKWNDGSVVEATQMFEVMISLFETKKHKLLETQIPYVLFRDRIERDKKIKERKDLWHISFKDRYKVPNYRFSISGRPMLYLGSSICDIIYEMKQENNCRYGMKKNKLSVFVLKKSKKTNGQTLKIFDLTNPFTRNNSILNNLMHSGVTIDYNDRTFGNWSELIPLYVKILILMSCCSFPTRQESAYFHEEYIIPQLLTEVLSKRGFDAVKYSSTRLDPSCLKSDSDIWAKNSLRENYVFFTHFDESNEYDVGLRNCFENSSPSPFVTFSLKVFFPFFEKKTSVYATEWLKKMAKKIVARQNSGFYGVQNIDDAMNYTLVPFETCRTNVVYNGENYWDTIYGKCEFNLLKLADKEGLF